MVQPPGLRKAKGILEGDLENCWGHLPLEGGLLEAWLSSTCGVRSFQGVLFVDLAQPFTT